MNQNYILQNKHDEFEDVFLNKILSTEDSKMNHNLEEHNSGGFKTKKKQKGKTTFKKHRSSRNFCLIIIDC